MIFCAAEAEARGDSMLGTAPPQARVLLVHQPGPWGPRGLIESRCDPEVARRIDIAAARVGMRLQTIRRPGKHEVGRPAGGFDVGIADSQPDAARIEWWSVDDLTEIVEPLETTGRPAGSPRAIETAPVFLVCAHARHDACCAVRGRPVAQALHAVRPGRVWETTHLGGDRFAANLLVLPTGELYGRVTPERAGEFADTVDAGNVMTDFVRGRIGLSPIAQSALFYAHQQLGIAARAALSVGTIEPLDADTSRVDIRTPNGSVVVTIVAETQAPAKLTCRGPQAAKARVYRGVSLTWCASTGSA